MNNNETYHSDTSRISKSGLDLIAKAPAKFYARYFDKSNLYTVKKHLNFGSAFHAAILEPELFRNEYIVAPEFHGTGSVARKLEFDQMNRGKKQITMQEYNDIQGMAKSVRNHPKISRLLLSGEAEKEFNWICEDTGAKCKCKPDWITPDGYILDLKSTDDASEDGFKRSARKWRYYVQDAFYTDGVQANDIPVKGFIFVAVEKEYPYLCNAFIYNREDQEIGRETYKDNIRTWLECMRTGIWEGYGDDFKELEIW